MSRGVHTDRSSALLLYCSVGHTVNTVAIPGNLAFIQTRIVNCTIRVSDIVYPCSFNNLECCSLPAASPVCLCEDVQAWACIEARDKPGGRRGGCLFLALLEGKNAPLLSH